MDKDFPVSGWTSLAIHGGHKKDPTYAHQVPIYASSTYVYDTAEQGMRRFSGQEEGYIYSVGEIQRCQKPKRKYQHLKHLGFWITTGQHCKRKEYSIPQVWPQFLPL